MRSDSSPRSSADRRTFLRGAAGVAGVAVVGAGAVPAPAAAQDGGSGDDLSSWFEGVSNYEGVVDRTGESEVTVEVGAQGNDGAFAFGPAAVRVAPGTTVVWEWTGDGGSHDVAAEDGSFGSEMVDEPGHTFEHAFEDPGVARYACTPHKPMGMKGAIVVGDEAAASTPEASDSDSADSATSDSTAADSAAAAESAASGSSDRSLGDLLTLGFGGALVAALLGLPIADRGRNRDGG